MSHLLRFHFVDDESGVCVQTLEVETTDLGLQHLGASMGISTEDAPSHPDVHARRHRDVEDDVGVSARKLKRTAICLDHVPDHRCQLPATASKSARVMELRAKGIEKLTPAELEEARTLAFELVMSGPP